MVYLLMPLIEMLLPPGLQFVWLKLLLQAVLATVVVLVTAQFTPKSIFLINPNKVLSIFSIPVYVVYIILYPVTLVVEALSGLVFKNLFKFDYSRNQPVFGLSDLSHFIGTKVQRGRVESANAQEIDDKIFANALEFKTIKVRDCMAPRTELITVDIEDSIEDLRQAFIESGYSKILVYKESIDNVIGYCNSLELFKKPKNIENMLIPIMFVPETMLASELMIQFITERKNIALVVDEFGGTSGIVTIEDIIEEIFGDIQDEHDEEDLVEVKINDENFIFSARQEIDYINDKYGLNLPIGEYDTLGGLILTINKDFPVINEEIEFGAFRFVILSIEENRIDKVKVIVGGEKEPGI